MRKHWRLAVWVGLWLVPMPLLPDRPVIALYWLFVLMLTGWAFKADMILEPKWSIDDELAEIQSWT